MMHIEAIFWITLFFFEFCHQPWMAVTTAFFLCVNVMPITPSASASDQPFGYIDSRQADNYHYGLLSAAETSSLRDICQWESEEGSPRRAWFTQCDLWSDLGVVCFQRLIVSYTPRLSSLREYKVRKTDHLPRLYVVSLFFSLKLGKDIEIIKSNGLKEMKTQVDIGSNFYVQAKM